MLKVPCKDCDRRHAGCHSSCEDYKAYKAENQKQLSIKNKNSLLDADIRAIRHDCLKKRRDK